MTGHQGRLCRLARTAPQADDVDVGVAVRGVHDQVRGGRLEEVEELAPRRHLAVFHGGHGGDGGGGGEGGSAAHLALDRPVGGEAEGADGGGLQLVAGGDLLLGGGGLDGGVEDLLARAGFVDVHGVQADLGCLHSCVLGREKERDG